MSSGFLIDILKVKIAVFKFQLTTTTTRGSVITLYITNRLTVGIILKECIKTSAVDVCQYLYLSYLL